MKMNQVVFHQQKWKFTIKLLLKKCGYRQYHFHNRHINIIKSSLILLKMHEVMGTTQFSSIFKRSKVALGNNQPRYNSHVQGIRDKFYINSTRNSQEIPEWMGRTNSHYMRTKMRGRSLNVHNQSGFINVRQTYVYQNKPKVQNTPSHFQMIPRKKIRSHWQMKNHTFELQWPKPEEKKQKRSSFQAQRSFFIGNDTPKSNTVKDFTFYLPKYGIKHTPLHIQQQTPIKIGHKSTVDTIRIK